MIKTKVPLERGERCCDTQNRIHAVLRCTIENCTRQRIECQFKIYFVFFSFINHHWHRIINSASAFLLIRSYFCWIHSRCFVLCLLMSSQCTQCSRTQIVLSRGRARAKLILMTNFIVIFVAAWELLSASIDAKRTHRRFERPRDFETKVMSRPRRIGRCCVPYSPLCWLNWANWTPYITSRSHLTAAAIGCVVAYARRIIK